jgi:hypothetical protein
MAGKTKYSVASSCSPSPTVATTPIIHRNVNANQRLLSVFREFAELGADAALRREQIALTAESMSAECGSHLVGRTTVLQAD